MDQGEQRDGLEIGSKLAGLLSCAEPLEANVVDRDDGLESAALRAFQSIPRRQAQSGWIVFESVEQSTGVGRQVRGIEVDRVERPPNVGAEDLVEQAVLVPEVGIDHLLVGLGGVRDAIDSRTGDPVSRELGRRRLQQTRLGLFGVPRHSVTIANN